MSAGEKRATRVIMVLLVGVVLTACGHELGTYLMVGALVYAFSR